LEKIAQEFQLEHTNDDQNSKIKEATKKYSIDKRNLVILDKGRELGEQSAILIKNGVLAGLGFIDLNHQLNNIHILESIITSMQGDDYSTFIIESYLRKRNRIKIIELNT
jgi:DNA polymerase-3 subunit epsilon